MRAKVWTLLLTVGVALALLALVPSLRELRLPGNHQGFEPEQPIAYSHRLHAGELGIQCQYCHSGADRSRYAGIPAAEVCMNCHRFVTAPRTLVRAEELAAEDEGREPVKVTSAEIAKLYQNLGLNEELVADGQIAPQPIRWRRVHQLPDFVYFDHRPHVAYGLACQKCHGAVETMERMRQVETLSMGWCVSCHRDPLGRGGDAAHPVASTDCSTCHY
jgi:hypothetical protein